MTAFLKLFQITTFRLSIIFMLIFSSAAALTIGYIYWRTVDILNNQLDQTIEAELKGVAEHYYQGGIRRLITAIALRSSRPGNSIYLISDEEGTFIAGNVQKVSQSLWNSIGKVEFSYTRQESKGEPSAKLKKRLAFASVFHLPNGYRMIVGRDIEDRRVFQGVIRSAIFWGLGGMLLVGLGTGWFLSQNITKRIEVVTQTTETIMAGDLSKRLPVKGSGDEFDRLSISFNTMLARLESLMQEIKEVSDNIAHDLKTPLTRMRNGLESALLDRDKTDHTEILEHTIDEADGLIKAFNAMLSIARLESGTIRDRRERVDLGEIAQDVFELYEPALEEEGGLLTLENAKSPIFVNIDRQLMGQAMSNVIDNAIKYAQSPTAQKAAKPLAIVIKCGYSDGGASITISDNGPGIPDSEKEAVFKRFYRQEKSRSLPGSGLGLSLVSAILKLHQGRVILEDNKPGLKVVMRLPLEHSKG